VNHLDDGGEPMMRRGHVAARFGDEQQQGGTQTLALIMGKMREQLVDAGPRIQEGLSEDAFNFYEIACDGCEPADCGARLCGRHSMAHGKLPGVVCVPGSCQEELLSGNATAKGKRRLTCANRVF
jgi:hypothetical protein